MSSALSSNDNSAVDNDITQGALIVGRVLSTPLGSALHNNLNTAKEVCQRIPSNTLN